MSNNNIRYYSTIVSIVVFFFGFSSAHAATLQIHANPITVSPGSIATVSVVINSEGSAINNAEAKIIFPTDLLEVVSINKSSSVFSLWVEEPAYSNLTGVVTFNGGIPTPGFTGSNGTALSIVVKAKAVGQADLIFSDAAVRANDGLGTDVLKSKRGTTIAIVKKDDPVVETISTPSPAPVPLQITSPTHASEEEWYKDNSPLFQWKVPTGSDAVQIGIATTTSSSPQVTYSPAIQKKSVNDLEDGIWYFKARARSGGVWGGTSTYIARIDSTVPQQNEVTFTFDNQKNVLRIDADIVDETSGIRQYDIYINDVLIQQVPSSEFVDGQYHMIVDTPGNNTVKLVAIDYAGNSVESHGTFTVIPAESHPSESVQPPTPTVTEQTLRMTIGSFSIPVLYAGIIMISVVLMLVIGAFLIGRHYGKSRNKHKTRTALSKEDNIKVLRAFKKRLEKHLEILQRTRRSRTLSKEEKDIKEAIEIDLDEVDKAIDDQKAG